MMQCSDKLGLSLELGSFAAGVMISTTDLAQHTLEQVIYYLYLARYFCSLSRKKGELLSTTPSVSNYRSL
jgi:Kef-type K+ transport system membrane component KefB